jgi:hypothetical protein
MNDEKKTVEQWAELKRLAAWKLAVARAHENWAIGQQLAEADFDQAVAAACNAPLR